MNYWKKINFYNSSGNKLTGLVNDIPSKRIVTVCHGFTGSKEGGGRALKMAEELAKRNWATILFDFAGCGESEGLFENLTLTRQIDDLTHAVNWCLKEGFTKIITVGRSFGGTTAICQAAQDKRVAGVCTWAAPSRLTRLFNSLKNNEENKVYLKNTFFKDIEQYDVLKCALEIAPRPLLIIHGKMDEVVPPGDAGLIYQAAKEPKELVLVNEGDHQFTNHYQEAWEALFNWLARQV